MGNVAILGDLPCGQWFLAVIPVIHIQLQTILLVLAVPPVLITNIYGISAKSKSVGIKEINGDVYHLLNGRRHHLFGRGVQ